MRGAYVKVEEIARRLGRHRSTIYWELKRNASAHDGGYRAIHACWKASGRQKRSRRNMRYGPGDFEPVEELLREDLSPEQVVGRMRLERRGTMSHETIYKWIWLDRRHGGTLWRHLRGARKQRRKRYGRNDSRVRLAGKRMIGKPPAVVERRSRIGDWEIDTVHGKGKAGVVTIVERRSGLVRIGKLERISMAQTGSRTVKLLSGEQNPVRTITADNGCEFHNDKRVEKSLGTTIDFATPHHSWERGTNENTNGLIRQYLPKGEDLAGLTQRECTKIAEKMNKRPRKRLKFRTPNEIYDGLSPVALQT
ncbi:IS30 family transposase [Haloferula luteola]|uniref:IS30 family transposase n=2 Tax=Haloferula luteola TaxID=595692 RepID=A0A840V6N1_9BACT|nr:IS30 family transposase [Haloferula luteola]